MRQKLKRAPSHVSTRRFGDGKRETARNGSARECVKDEQPTVSLQRCVKPAGPVSWRAIAQLKPALLPWARPTTCAMLHTCTTGSAHLVSRV